ncbi:MAG: cobalamin biosynthesis protein CbiX [Verrucomicrobiales bacterium]|nr:cobalamin biosynthesis protein CbiX [Verrucomicrobiales bacterium]
METHTFHDAALVLIAHGSSLNPGSAAPAYLQAAHLRARGMFAEVCEAFHQQDPPVTGVLRRVSAPRVFVVPMFISEGWFAEQVIPGALGLRNPGDVRFERVQRRGNQVIHYCHPVGSHASMTEVLLARAREVVRQHPFPSLPDPARTALLIAGHGTTYSRGSRESIERQVTLLKERAIYGSVHGLFLEEEPRIAEAWTLPRERNVVLVPFFISDGLHTQEDIPVMLGESEAVVRARLASGKAGWRNPTHRQGKRLWCAGALGTEPVLSDVILERVVEAAAWTQPAAGDTPAAYSTPGHPEVTG